MWGFDTPHKDYMNLYSEKEDLLSTEIQQKIDGYKTKRFKVIEI